MLCQFSFQNFKSYKGETTLDFQAATLPEFKETLITEEKATDLLPVSVIYGPNGGGKSNLLQALSCVISTIVKPVHELEKNRQNLILQQKLMQYHSYSTRIQQTNPQSSVCSLELQKMSIATTSLSKTTRSFQNHYTVSQSPARSLPPSLSAN